MKFDSQWWHGPQYETVLGRHGQQAGSLGSPQVVREDFAG